MANHARVGSIITGTLRPKDLIRAFADELQSLDATSKYARVIDAARTARSSSGKAREALSELEEALGELAPPYCYFGAHWGDGADFGYWPDWDAIENDRRDGTLPSGGEIPADGSEAPYFLHVSDHGNAELYTWDATDRRWRSVWGVV